MSVSALIQGDSLVATLRRLCAQPGSAGQNHELATTADLVAGLLRRAGLTVKVARTSGAPVVLGWRAGRSPFTLLLYHHYDVAPSGPWRDWSHEPFQLAERDGALYGRGVAHGKGPLTAHLEALRVLANADAELPCGIVFVVEGEGLSGSARLASVIAEHQAELRADACLGSAGERDVAGRPFCYSGSKGMLQVQLTTRGAAYPLPAGMAASVRNPVWRLVWALSHIKGEDEDVRITGFYDAVEGPSRSENAALRQVRLDEAGRLAAWQLSEFLFGMSNAALIRAEATLPTCNISMLSVTPGSDVPGIPALASANLDFHLVPHQQPEKIFDLLREHLIARNFDDIAVAPLPGSYAPIQTAVEQPFIQHLIAAGEPVYAAPLPLASFGPFSLPLQLFAHHLHVPVAALGFARHTSAVRAADEQTPLDDLVRHGQLLVALCAALGAAYPAASQAASLGRSRVAR